MLFSNLLNFWPFFTKKTDDLSLSARLVQRLSIPEHTKQFVFAVHDPGSQAVVYILAVQNLSEQSCLDIEYLIRAVRPSAVIAQVDPSAVNELQTQDKSFQDESNSGVPASPLQVLKRCFVDKLNKDQYEKIAASHVLKEIFGVGLYGHFVAAKRAAELVGSSFLLLESPYDRNRDVYQQADQKETYTDASMKFYGFCLGPGWGPVTSTNSSQFSNIRLTYHLQSQMIRLLTPSLNIAISQVSNETTSKVDAGVYNPSGEFQVPPFASAFYPLLNDLRDVFGDVPAVGKALQAAQNLLSCVHEGKPVNSQTLSDVYVFRIAVEGLRVGFNSAARSPSESKQHSSSPNIIFSELPKEEKCNILFAQVLQGQARRHGTLVAVVDASCLAGLRRCWNTPVSSDIRELAELYLDKHGEDDSGPEIEFALDDADRRALLADKPVVAVGAGATAILSASSLSKVIHAPALVKLAAYKAPLALKHGLIRLHRQAAIGLAKFVTSSKLVTPSLAGTGSQASAYNMAASAEKIRAVTHTVLTSAQRTSLMAVRTAFYEIMQKKGRQPLKVAPWAMLGCSMATCTGLLTFGDGIECVAESAPSIPTIATLGRGLEGLRLTSEELRKTSGDRIKAALESLMADLQKTTK